MSEVFLGFKDTQGRFHFPTEVRCLCGALMSTLAEGEAHRKAGHFVETTHRPEELLADALMIELPIQVDDSRVYLGCVDASGVIRPAEIVACSCNARLSHRNRETIERHEKGLKRAHFSRSVYTSQQEVLDRIFSLRPDVAPDKADLDSPEEVFWGIVVGNDEVRLADMGFCPECQSAMLSHDQVRKHQAAGHLTAIYSTKSAVAEWNSNREEPF